MMFDLLCVTYFINKTSKFVLLFGRSHLFRHTHTTTHANIHREYPLLARGPLPLPKSVRATRTNSCSLRQPQSSERADWLQQNARTHPLRAGRLMGCLSGRAELGCVKLCQTIELRPSFSFTSFA